MIINAKIKYSFLGFDPQRELYIKIGFISELEEYNIVGDVDKISSILNVLDLNQWEEVPRKYCRIKISDNGSVEALGNLIENRWVTF